MDKKYTWNLESMYENDSLIEKDRQAVKKDLDLIEKLKENPLDNIKELLEAIERSERTLTNVMVYSFMRKDEDSRVSKYQKMDMENSTLAVEHSSKTAFLTPFILSLSEDETKALMEREDLKKYHSTIEKILRFKPHTLSEKEEFIMSSLAPSASTAQEIYYFLTNADMTFPEIDKLEGEKLTGANFVKFQMHEDRELRKEVFEKFYGTYNSYANTIAKAYYSNLNTKAIYAKLKGYKSVRHMELYNDDVDEKVYDALIDSIHNNLDIMDKYYGIKKRSLGLEEQHMYDVYMPIDTGFEKTYSFEEAKELCIASVAPLGKEYQEIYKTAFEDRWIDVYPREGKRGGAYSAGSYDSYPFVSMNFNGTLDSVFTLAHEMGHSMHSYMSRKNNDFLESSYTIFAAEVASTFNENLLLDYMMERAESKEERLFLIDHHANSFKSTVFRQTMFAEFEREVHKLVEDGQGLTAEDFNKIYYDLNVKYFGNHMVSDEEIAYEWMRIPHFYRDFYVYKYATGYTASTVLAQKVLAKEENAVENYMKFLKDGGKHFPIDQLKIAGVDMSKPETVDQALNVFRNLVDDLDKLI